MIKHARGVHLLRQCWTLHPVAHLEVSEELQERGGATRRSRCRPPWNRDEQQQHKTAGGKPRERLALPRRTTRQQRGPRRRGGATGGRKAEQVIPDRFKA